MMNMEYSLKLTTILIIFLTFFKAVHNSVPCDLELSVILNNVQKIENGSLIAEDNTVYKRGQYFIDEKNNTRGCICNIKTCIRKCCPLGQSLINDNYKCVNGSENLRINDISFVGFNRDNETIKISYENYGFIFGNPCAEYYISDFKISKSGLVKEQLTEDFADENQFDSVGSDDLYHDIFEYCIERIDNKTSLLAIICFPSGSDTSNYSYPGIYIKSHSFLAISFFILFISLFFAMPVTMELKNLRGLCLINQTICSFMVFSLIVISCYYTKTSSSFQTNLLGFVFYFTYFAAAIWMTVICYDILQYFRFLTVTDNEKLNTDRMGNVKRFIFYSAFTWVTALLVSIVLISIYSICFPDEKSIFRTELEEESSTNINKNAVWLFFYIPLATIHLISVILFRAAMKKQKELKKNGLLKNREFRWNNMQEYVGISLQKKICVTIGVLWLIEIIGFCYVCIVEEVLTSFWWECPVLIMNSLRSFSIVFIIIMNEPNKKNSFI